jgi:glutamate-1-semialdehyde 2,1-aminomutase
MNERTRSKELFELAKKLMPGGVSSPVRAFQPYPCYIKSGKGSRITDVDGNEYIDYCMAYGPLILGHADPKVIGAIKAQADLGTLYGAPIEMEVDYARLIKQYYPSMEMMRFVSSGTEATMHAIRLARGYTGRKKIIKVEGAFHGSHDVVLVKAGSGATTHSSPDSAGVLEEVTRNTLIVPYNDPDAILRAINENKGEVAAMILEPVIGNAGPILPKEGYLQQLREIATAEDVLLIFDEVITGFRLAMGGAQEYYGVRPDITTLGKIAGGGMPIGIFGASEDIMKRISPSGNVYQAGTFSGNPMSLAAGMEAVKQLAAVGHDTLNANGERMRQGLEAILNEFHVRYRVSGIGSMFQVFFTTGEVNDYQDAKRSDTVLFMKVFHKLLENGIYLPPSQFETNFLSTAHTEADVDETVNAFAMSLGEVTR